MSPVIVHLLAPNAISLHVDEMRDAGEHGDHGAFSMNTPGTGTARRGPEVELRPGRNEVDPDFWRAWAEQHKGSSLLGMLRVEDQEQDQKQEMELKGYGGSSIGS
jgi:hypothetical protein